MMAIEQQMLAQTVANLDGWLDTMRVTDAVGRSGYGGPVVHWWQNCLTYTGPGLDWRYEGIILGYLALWQRTGEICWREKACRAGDDLVEGQLPGGNYLNSSFEQNPYSGGTPHEAAADLGLLRLALVLRDAGDARWQRYEETAARNLHCYYLERLWDETAQSFRDHTDIPSLVPNKACTLVEALFALAELAGNDELIVRYALPTLNAVLALQIHAPARLAGAIPQDVQRGRITHKYFPYYIARCIPALLLAYEHTGRQCYLDGAVAALRFVVGQVGDDGLLPQVVYPHEVNVYPQWSAPLGDVLCAARLLAAHEHDERLTVLREALLAGQLPSGGMATANGFSAQIKQHQRGGQLPDFRDNLPVTGWADKAFRYLADELPTDVILPPAKLSTHETPCEIKGQEAVWLETEAEMRLTVGGRTRYHWHKGEPWAAVVTPEVMWK